MRRIVLIPAFCVIAAAAAGIATAASQSDATNQVAASIDQAMASPEGQHASQLPSGIVCPTPASAQMTCRPSSGHDYTGQAGVYTKIIRGGLSSASIGQPLFGAGEISCAQTTNASALRCSLITAANAPTLAAGQTMIVTYFSPVISMANGRGLMSRPPASIPLAAAR
jgi:hypothetical protein